MQPKKYILPIIVLAQFCCTSLWFAGNSIITDLIINFNLKASVLGHLTSAIQLGFILGTLVFAILTLADKYSPSKVFFLSALLAALFNLAMSLGNQSFYSLILIRFLVGFFLAGIYPVGMKIASDYFKEGLGKSLGFLVGALVLGTAFPHLLKSFNGLISWKAIIYFTSLIALLGGLLILIFVPNGPYKKTLKQFDITVFYKVFKIKNFRTAALGYFGHMWELYTFWAFVPMILLSYSNSYIDINLNIPVLSFIIIGLGGIACVISGYLSQIFGVKKLATTSLALSCICCLLTPFVFIVQSELFFIAFMIFWGMVVIADSPLFSTLVAQNVASESKGTALTIVNSIGFAITIISIQLLNTLLFFFEIKYLLPILAIGPILGLFAMYNKVKSL
ncbi:MFS transporter [Flaviramulus aquimarinus]|uniref:MFS transporter n=1 Tax=Flaviramulus aquimarinus TaxID=1170456 RepID=A0ABP9EYP5_9FLAO